MYLAGETAAEGLRVKDLPIAWGWNAQSPGFDSQKYKNRKKKKKKRKIIKDSIFFPSDFFGGLV